MDKQSLRQYIREKKRAMTPEQIEEKSSRLAALLFSSPYYRKADTIYGYLPFNQEVRTLPILEQAIRDGKKVALPKIDGKQMHFVYMDDFTKVSISPIGAPEPIADGPVAEDKTALVLMPGLAFDEAGHRIGYGGGYYDRFLAKEPNHPTVALCYDFQLLPKVETKSHDIPVQFVFWA